MEFRGQQDRHTKKSTSMFYRLGDGSLFTSKLVKIQSDQVVSEILTDLLKDIHDIRLAYC